MASQLADGIKYDEKNPAIVTGGASLALVAGNLIIINITIYLLIYYQFIGFFAYRKAQMKRNVHDYDSQLTGGFKILNNEGISIFLSLLFQYLSYYFHKIIL